MYLFDLFDIVNAVLLVPTTHANELSAKGSRKLPPSIVLLHGRLKDPIFVSDQL